MASPSPPILPVTTPQPLTTTTATTTTTDPPTQPSPIRTFVANLHTQLTDGLSHRRPWSELTDRTAFSKPESLSDAALRIRKNYSYFRINYLSIITAVVALSLITNPLSLLLLSSLLAAWCFLYLFKPNSDQPTSLFGRTFSDKEILAFLVIFSIFVIFLTNVGSVLMSSIVVGVAIVCAHGAFRVPEDLFLDDQDNAAGVSSGFLTFLGATTKSAAASASATVAASRV